MMVFFEGIAEYAVFVKTGFESDVFHGMFIFFKFSHDLPQNFKT